MTASVPSPASDPRAFDPPGATPPPPPGPQPQGDQRVDDRPRGAGPPRGVSARGLNLGIAQRPLGVLEILDSAMRLYRDNAKPMLVLGLCTVTVCVGISVALIFVLLQGLAPSPNAVIQVAGYLNYLSVGALSLAGTAIAGVQTIAVARAFEGDPCTTGEAVRIMLRRSPRLFGLWLFAKVLQAGSSSFCGFPLLFTTALFAITGPLVAREQPSLGRFLRRILDLIGKRLWANVLLVVLVGVSSYLLQYGLVAGLGLIGLAGVVGVTTASPAVVLLSYALSQILTGTLLMPFVAATATVTYFDAMVRFDGYDLVETARGLDPRAVEVPGA